LANIDGGARKHPARSSTRRRLFAILAVALSPIGFAAFLISPWIAIFLWASATLIASLVLDRVLLQPLRALRRTIAAHVPGTPFPLSMQHMPVPELHEIGQAFGAHEAELATALIDQSRATREVHHRVKNNLQVIASLISLHARGNYAPDAATAYAAIQRRVDALSIVHRNHHAELDSEGGIDLKGLLTELATSLRAGAVAQGTPATITISAPKFGVSQNSAVAIAFLLTELVEMSMSIDAAAAIEIAVTKAADADKASLSLTSAALLGDAPAVEYIAARYARIIAGLSRQLRAPLSHDPQTGSYAIDFAPFAQNSIENK